MRKRAQRKSSISGITHSQALVTSTHSSAFTFRLPINHMATFRKASIMTAAVPRCGHTSPDYPVPFTVRCCSGSFESTPPYHSPPPRSPCAQSRPSSTAKTAWWSAGAYHCRAWHHPTSTCHRRKVREQWELFLSPPSLPHPWHFGRHRYHREGYGEDHG